MRGITLIGMPTAGKTTIGRLLAESLGWPLYDIDSMMEESEGKKLADIKLDVEGKDAKMVANEILAMT